MNEEFKSGWMAKKIEIVPLNDLVPYEKNFNRHPRSQIRQIINSIEEFGWTNPILIDKDQGIVAGHGRFEAAKQMGLLDVPVIKLDHLSDTQKRAFLIADNQIQRNSDFDHDLLADELISLREDDFDLDLLGFDEEQLLDILPEETEESGGSSEVDDVPETEKNEFNVERGQVWLLGRHRIICGDATDAEDYQKLMAGEEADLWITDPPYNVSYEGETAEKLTIQNDTMEDGDFRGFLKKAFQAAKDCLRPGASFYIWHADSEGYNFRGACFDVDLKIRQCLIWLKDSMVMGRQDYHSKHEPCLYGWKDGAGHFWNSDRKQTTVLEFIRPKRNDVHPTMKPVDLIAYQMKNNSKKGELVLDCFLGSGTTLMAAEREGRKCYGLQIDPHYCSVIIKRWQDYTGQEAKLAD
jgi:DNA modification methylase